ncbi:DUF3857 domain-containing protein [Winogradskyella sp. R77965]|uniref:DUF3857 domain-containing protein n=1 Tax=Winogradskyella sp. R77965 TaxID=3093872 RepID=UPI0037DC111A
MKIKLLPFAFIITFLSFSQNYQPAMSVSKSDLELTTYVKDSTANALVIYDYGNSFVDNKTFWLRVQVRQKIKILRTEGVERGEFEVKLYKGKSSEEKIKDIKGTTYNLKNGNIIKTYLKPSAIFKEENEKFTLVKFVLPNVKVGSVITVSYETQSRFMTKYQPWYFQGPDPVLYSEYNTSIPANYNYHVKLVGGIKLVTNEAKIERNCIEVGNGGHSDCTVSRYVMKEVPAYKPEGFTTTALNYTSRIEYELNEIKRFDGGVNKLSKTWKNVDKELKTDKDFGRQISKKSLVKDILPESISSIEDNLNKAKSIYQFVLDNYKWNEKYERYDVSIKDLNKEKVGSAFEINLLLENLLTNQGFTVYPILISTRANGLATKIYPVLTDFNYVILKTTINDKDYFLDATDPYLAFGELPFRCLNQYGRLMDFENGSYWEDVKIENYSASVHRIELNLNDEENFNGKISSKYSGYPSHKLKRNYHENPVVYKENKTNIYSNISIEEHDVSDLDKNSYNFEEKIEFTLEPELIGNKIYLDPFIIKFFEENPFKLQERTYPIDFGYKDAYSYILKIDIGEDLNVIDMPKAVSYALPNKAGSFIFNIDKKENQLLFYFKVKFDKAIYEAQFYEHLKTFMSKIVEAQKNTVIVLEKQ